MEFLIGRTLANNITNLQVEEFVRNDFASDAGQDWQTLFDEEPDAGLGNGGLGRLAACFLDSLATLQIPAVGYGLRYEYGMFRQEIKDGRQVEHPDNWLIRPDPWEVVRPAETVEVRLNCSFQMREGRLTVTPNVPTILRGIPYDRPVVGYGGRDHQHASALGRRRPRGFQFPGVQPWRFLRRRPRKGRRRGADARPLSGRFHPPRPQPAVRPGVLSGGVFAGRHRGAVPPPRQRLEGPSRQGRRAAQRHAPRDGRRRADADLARPSPSRLGRSLGPDPAHPGLHQSHADARGPRNLAGQPLRDGRAPSARDHLRDQPPLPGRRSRPLPRRPRPRLPRQPDHRRARKARSHGQPGDRRHAQHQRRGRDPLRGCCGRPSCPTWPRSSPNGSTTRPTA